MSRFIGTITDKSYHQEFNRIKNNRIYYYSICPTCQEKLDEGFSGLDGGGRTAVLPHICRKFEELAKMLGSKNIPKVYFQWGQFIFKADVWKRKKITDRLDDEDNAKH